MFSTRHPLIHVALIIAQSIPEGSVNLAAWLRIHSQLLTRDQLELPVYQADISGLFRCWLDNLDKPTIEELKRAPIWYLLPFYQIATYFLNNSFTTTWERLPLSNENWEIDGLPSFMSDVSGLQYYSEFMLEPLILLLKQYPSEAAKPVFENMDSYWAKVDGSLKHWQNVLDQKVALASLEESKRSIAQAESVKQINVLAFIFIPLSFAASLFGMNVTELGTGSSNIWAFASVASSMVVVVSIMFFCWKKRVLLERLLKSTWGSVGRIPKGRRMSRSRLGIWRSFSRKSSELPL